MTVPVRVVEPAATTEPDAETSGNLPLDKPCSIGPPTGRPVPDRRPTVATLTRSADQPVVAAGRRASGRSGNRGVTQGPGATMTACLPGETDVDGDRGRWLPGERSCRTGGAAGPGRAGGGPRPGTRRRGAPARGGRGGRRPPPLPPPRGARAAGARGARPPPRAPPGGRAGGGGGT